MCFLNGVDIRVLKSPIKEKQYENFYLPLLQELAVKTVCPAQTFFVFKILH